jgi:hypothetical protein
MTKKVNSKKKSKSNSKTHSKIHSKAYSKTKNITSKINKLKNGNSLNNIKKNLESMKKKLEDKNMDNIFWVIADRADFKPLTKIIVKSGKEVKQVIHSIKELRDNLLDEKGEYYKKKKLSSIKITFDTGVLNKLSKLEYSGLLSEHILNKKEFLFIKEKPILSIEINVYPVDDSGNINTNSNSCWGVKVNYYIDDFTGIKFKLKNIEVLMRLTSDSVVKSDLNKGIEYKNLAVQLNKKN